MYLSWLFSTQKGYRYYSIEKKCYFVSRDVNFFKINLFLEIDIHKNMIPIWTLKQGQTIILLVGSIFWEFSIPNANSVPQNPIYAHPYSDIHFPSHSKLLPTIFSVAKLNFKFDSSHSKFKSRLCSRYCSRFSMNLSSGPCSMLWPKFIFSSI